MVKKFKYNSRGEIKDRKVFVLQENSTYLNGLDFSYLTEDEQKDVLEVLKEHQITDVPPKGTKAPPVNGYKPEWNKAWRCFKKDSFIVEKNRDENSENVPKTQESTDTMTV